MVVARSDGHATIRRPDDPDRPDERLPLRDLPRRVAELEEPEVRWVWADSRAISPVLLAAGVRVARALDLRLVHVILRQAEWASGSELATAAASVWDEAPPAADLDESPTLWEAFDGPAEVDVDEVTAELDRQRRAIEGSAHADRLRLLAIAESVGALIAAELTHGGLPFDVVEHDRRLTEQLGPRPHSGARPALVQELVERLRVELGSPSLNPESQPLLLRALRSSGIEVTSTRQWELEQVEHPAIPVLLHYKKLQRLLSANGWAWADRWVRGGRFRPDYVPGGVVTGRWATQGGGALQLPKQVRGAVVADEGWRLVVADAAQLEPRVLAAMSADRAMAEASRGHDLYAELVAAGVVATRPQAKVAMLGALYGATTGEAGALMPGLLRAYPQATGLVEQAARDGERGRRVTTWLGRTSPSPGEAWQVAQAGANGPTSSADDQRTARRRARDWGRFTRNFVVQGTAAEWALCWLASVRRDLRPLGSAARRPELVYFLHDEIIVHTPAELVDEVVDVVLAGAAQAGRLLFGDFPVEFPVEPVVVRSYAEAV